MKLKTIRYPNYYDEQFEILAGIQRRYKSEIIRDALKSSMREAAAVYPEVAAIAQAAAQVSLEQKVEEIKEEFGPEIVENLYLPGEL